MGAELGLSEIFTKRGIGILNLEQVVNYQLNKFPGIKKVVKRAYQLTMYAISPKLKSVGNIERISPGDPDHEYFFGYYDKSPWDRTDRFVLCMRAKDTWSDVSPKEKADILLIDTQKGEGEAGRVRKVAETRAWNVQQACMLQWLGPDFSSRILYNDYREEKYVSVILDLASGKERIIPAPVYAVSNDGKTALTLDFSRLYNLRPGYGYRNVPEKTKGIALPDATAIWHVDLESGLVSPLLSYRDFANFEARSEMKEKGAVHKVNHIMINPAGNRFMVLYRWFVGQRKYTRLITCNIDGTEPFLLSDDDMVSHCHWKNNDHILAFENKKKGGPGYYLMKDRTDSYHHCWPQLSNDGHPSYSPDGSLIVTDTYPDRSRIAEIKLMDGLNEKKNEVRVIARVFAPFKYDNDTRCDLHPRWNHAGNKICFDSVFEGHRGLYEVKVHKHEPLEQDKTISVIIPIYNAEKYLKRCLDSVARQTYQSLEIILVNDGSTDGSFEICKDFQKERPNVILINQKNGGLSAARNAGLQAATGDYVAFLDSDDWIAPDMYSYMLNLIEENNADIADVMPIQVRSEREKFPAEEEKTETLNGSRILEHYLYRGMHEKNGAPYSACRKLYKKDLFIGDTARFQEGTVNEDICFNYRILKKCARISVSNQVKYFYFQGDNGITSGALRKKDLALLKVSRELVKLAEREKNGKILELAKMKEARSYFSLLARIARDGISEEFERPEELIRKLRKHLNRKLPLLLKSPMPIARKVLAIAFVVQYNGSCKLIKALKI